MRECFVERLLQGVANSSRPQDMHVFVSVCVWEVGEVTTGSSPQPWSTSYSSWCGRTFHAEPLIPGKCREGCEDTSHTEGDAQGCSLRVRVGQGTPESRIHSGHLVTEREDSVSDNRRLVGHVLRARKLGPIKVSLLQRTWGQAYTQTFGLPPHPAASPGWPGRNREFYSSLPRPQIHPKTVGQMGL